MYILLMFSLFFLLYSLPFFIRFFALHCIACSFREKQFFFLRSWVILFQAITVATTSFFPMTRLFFVLKSHLFSRQFCARLSESKFNFFRNMLRCVLKKKLEIIENKLLKKSIYNLTHTFLFTSILLCFQFALVFSQIETLTIFKNKIQ